MADGCSLQVHINVKLYGQFQKWLLVTGGCLSRSDCVLVVCVLAASTTCSILAMTIPLGQLSTVPLVESVQVVFFT